MTTASRTASGADLSVLARPSGGFAMLALDQRESMRAMFAEHQNTPVTDEQLTEFKLRAAAALSAHASGVLLDRQFALDRAVAQGVVAPDCGLIAAADEFLPDERELVADVRIDHAVDPDRMRRLGAVALKLLVVWRPDEDPRTRVAMVQDFVARCRRAGLVSIIEPVSRAPRRQDRDRDWDWDAGVLAAARELGSLGADLYKAEVPLHGDGTEPEVRRRCAALTEAVASPWVVLSSGVGQDRFPRAVELACREGASGFLAGRAVWRSVIAAADLDAALRREAVPRLRRLADIVDDTVGARHAR